MRNSKALHWASALQLGLSLVAVSALWGAALSFLLLGAARLFNPQAPEGETVSFFLLAAGGVLGGILLPPSVYYSFLRLSGRQAWQPKWQSLQRILYPNLLLLLFPIVLFLGNWATTNLELVWLVVVLPPLHLLAMGLPTLWLLWLGKRKLPAGSPQRAWGVFGSGLILGPALIIVFEIVAAAIFGFIALLYLAGHPKLLNDLESLTTQLALSSPSPEVVLETLGPYLLRPEVFAATVVFAALVVPLVEELFKPIGVWLLLGRKIRPVEGFTAGLLSGAGYALFENLALGSSALAWTPVVLGRIGTGVIHIFTTGVMGWALASAREEGRYRRLATAYLSAVLIHGLWNGLALLSVFDTLATELNETFLGETPLIAIVPLSMAAMAVTGFVLLGRINRGFQQELFSASLRPASGD